MRAVIQRVKQAKVEVEGQISGAIGKGLLLLVGFEELDSQEDLDWMLRKIVNMRIFNDQDGVMNLNVVETGGQLLLVSQFTLHASTKKGNRPSYIKSAKPDIAIPLYQKFISMCAEELPTETGIFGANMHVELINDGPVTIWLDSKDRQ